MRRCRIESLGVSAPRQGLLKWGSVRHAVQAGRRCLERSRHHPQDVGVLINTGVYRDDHVCEPAIAAYIQHRLGINIDFQGPKTLSFDLLNGGCGMLSGLQVLTALMASGETKVGMVVSSEANTDRRPDAGYTYPPTGAAVLVDFSPQNAVGFGAFAFHTREEHADLFTSVVSLKEKRGRLLVRRDPKLEDAWLACSGPAVDEVLERDGLRREDIGLVIPAQIGGGFLSRLPEAIGIAPEKVVDASRELPDTHSTSVFLALAHVLETKPPAPGTKALLLAFASGVTVGAATYQF